MITAIALLGCAAQAPAVDPPPPWGGKADGQSERRADWVRAEITTVNEWLSDADRAAKYDKMAASAYSFYRGTNHIFWADLAGDPRLEAYGGSEETETWLQGDLHAYNYGTFDNDEGEIVYDLNDFDEGVVADYQLDVWRMAVSIVLVANENGLEDPSEIVDAFSESYLDALASYRGNRDEDDRIFTAENTYGRLDELLEEVEEDESRLEMLDVWTVLGEDGRTFDFASEKLEEVDDELRAAIEGAMLGYGETLSGGIDWDPSYFEVRSIARRLHAGTGSLGTPRFYVLIEGPTTATDDDVILDVKRQGEPTGLRYLPERTRASHALWFEHGAERVVTAQRALGVDVDDHLGWMLLDDGGYSVRARSPFKDELDTEDLDSMTRMTKLAEQWGEILATAHARADRDFDEDFVPYSFDREVDERTDGDHEGFRRVVRELAVAYAAQVERDYRAFLELAEAEATP